MINAADAAVPLYTLNNIAKTYSAREGPVVSIPALTIPRGKVIALIGFSGSGKTTLLNILAMLETPDRSPAFSSGGNPTLSFTPLLDTEKEELLLISDERRQKLRTGFGFVFQQGYLLENLSCGDNIRIPFNVRKLEPGGANVVQMMRAIGLDETMAERQPSDLSGGERQRISVLRALAHNPSVVFADEPTSNLDEANAAAVLAGLHAWCEAAPNHTVVLVTHNIGHAVRYADMVILMASGKISGPFPLTSEDGTTLTAVELSARLAEFSDQNRRVSGESRSSQSFLPIQPAEKSSRPIWNTLRFVCSFAFSDVFPRVSGDASGGFLRRMVSKGFFQGIFRRRNAQFHSMASMFFAMVLALFFASLYSALAEQFQSLVDDRRVARIEVLGRRDGERLLSQRDIEALSGLSWASGRGSTHIASPDEIRSGHLRAIAPAVEAAVGYRVREMRSVRNPQISDIGFNSDTNLSVVSTRVSDPILRKVEILKGTQVNKLSPGEQTVGSVFENSAESRVGLICTKASLVQLGFTDTIPKSIDVYPPYGSDRTESIPLVGVVEWLPKSADALITEELYQKFFFGGGTGDALPRFESVDIYFGDMMKDGVGLYETLDRLGYSVSADRLGLLRWVVSLVRAIRYFSLAAGVGIFLVVLVTLVVSYSEAIRRKEKQIGVLIAYGTSMSLLYSVFIAEVLIVWFIAAGLAIPSHWIVAEAVENLVARGFELRGAQQISPPVPWALWIAILSASLFVALMSVVWTMRRNIDASRVAETLRSPD